MDATTTRKAGEIRLAVRTLGPRGRGRRYPEALKREVLAYLAERRKVGRGIATASAELGIPEKSIKLWAQAPRSSAIAKFVPVTVVEPSEVALPRSIVVYGPGGVRVEGLDLVGIADLLLRLA